MPRARPSSAPPRGGTEPAGGVEPRADAREYPGAQNWVPPARSLSALRSAAQECRGCDLYRDATQAVMGEGPVPARLMLIGEQPGDKEDLAGEPFVGPAGRLLDRALEAAGIDRGAAYRTNVVKHFRFTGRGGKRLHRSPTRWQVAACQPWLLAELETVRPGVVVLLGATAGQAVHGPSFRVGASRGAALAWPVQRLALEQPPEVVIATAHPSSVLRSRDRQADLEALVADLSVAAARL